MPDRSEFFAGQLSEWIEDLAREGRTEYLFELEMWLKSFERYFRVANQPRTPATEDALAIRSFYEELGLVAAAIRRVMQLCTLLATEDRVSQERFAKYVENYLRRDDVTDPFVARLLRASSPAAALTLLRESLEDVHLLLRELTQLSRIPYATFQSVGRILFREVRRNEYLALLLDRKFKPAYDRIASEPIVGVIRRIEDRDTRRILAAVFLELFRLLHYLDFADPHRRSPEELKTTVLIFSLVAAEARSLIERLEGERARWPDGTALAETVDGFVYCVPLELRKVIDTELSDLSSLRQADSVYMRIENSHGILRDCFQQSVIQLAQVFDPSIDGARIFARFATRLEQSLALRDDLVRLIAATRRFDETRTETEAERLRRLVSRFYDRSLRYLMYRDWSGFEAFYVEMLRCRSLTGLVQIAHRFETYLRTLLEEIGKRGVLRGAYAPSEGDETPAPRV